MSLFDELFAKYKKEQDEEKNVQFVTCVREVKNTNASDLSPNQGNPSATDHLSESQRSQRNAPSFTHSYVNSSTRAQVTDRTPSPDPVPGQCDLCPAYGFWEGHGPEPFCFYEAYFLAKPAEPQLAKKRQPDCPL